jgi:hypothetical protein
MAGIYVDQHCDLSELLTGASNDQGATLLIPDLQRPYIWEPDKVVLLVDSLVRGWPFGTFLTWKVGKDDPIQVLARSFWKVVDRTDGGNTEQVSKKNPPGAFQMVLDGQQRIQSLLLALGGDAWGFKLFDRDWHTVVADEKTKGRQGGKHWSLGCLCVDLDALGVAYAKSKRIMSLDFTGVLSWVVTGGPAAQSEFEKKKGYRDPLPNSQSAEGRGRFVRLSRLWSSAPTVEGIEQEQADVIAEELLKEHDVQGERLNGLTRPVGSLLLNLARVKRTRVTYLELAEFDSKIFTRETYNDAVVNIFTRLNSAGRVLTREDITFAWLKVGWNAALTGNRSAGKCFEDLRAQLKESKLDLLTEDLIAGVSFVWAIAHRKGLLLGSDDLLKGDAIRPMAVDLSQNWATLCEAVVNASAAIADHGLAYREHYQSLNSMYVLWAWYYIAEQWIRAHQMKELDKDAFAKHVEHAIDDLGDRWLACSQWAGRWAVHSAVNVAGYAQRLFECNKLVQPKSSHEEVTHILRSFLDAEVKALEVDALTWLQGLNVARRELVRVYYTPLWIWHRLDSERWKMSRYQLRIGKRKATNYDVDHSVAFALWEKKVANGLPEGFGDPEKAVEIVNHLGNCCLLKKSFNISKSDRTLRSFMEEVHEIKEKEVDLWAWARSMGFTEAILDPDSSDLATVASAIDERDKLVRRELGEFVSGKRSRVDLDEP